VIYLDSSALIKKYVTERGASEGKELALKVINREWPGGVAQ